MKVTIKLEESAGLTPKQVVEMQAKAAYERKACQILRHVLPSQRVVLSSGFAGLNIGEVLTGGVR